MTRKVFLYGLGAGFIAGSVLVQLGQIGEQASRPLDHMPVQELTREQFRSIAEQYGYGLYDKNEPVIPQAEAERLAAEAAEQARSEALEEAEEKGSKTVYAFTIAPGSTLQQTALMLESIGFVEEAEAFMREMKAQGLASRIRAGAYRFDSIPSFQELTETLTSPP